MAITILYFGQVRERIGADGESASPPRTVATAGDLVDWLALRSPAHHAAFEDRTRLRVAIDQRFATFDMPIAGAREIALFPPVTGG